MGGFRAPAQKGCHGTALSGEWQAGYGLGYMRQGESQSIEGQMQEKFFKEVRE